MKWRKMIHFWQDGISFGDGPLVPADDPAAARLIAEVQSRGQELATVPARQRMDLHRSMKQAVTQAVEGGLRWALPADLRPLEDGEVEDYNPEDLVGMGDEWTIVRHAVPFRVYGEGALDFFRAREL